MLKGRRKPPYRMKMDLYIYYYVVIMIFLKQFYPSCLAHSLSFYFRTNFIQLNVFMQELSYEEIIQQPAYDTLNLLGNNKYYSVLINL